MSTWKYRTLPPVLPFLVHVIHYFPLARWSLLLTLLLLILEYAGISVMIPLAVGSEGGNGNSTSADVNRLWGEAIAILGLKPTLMTWVWMFLVLLALRTAAGYGHVLVTTYLSKQVHRRFSEDVFRRVLVDEPMTQIFKRSIGYYVSLAGEDTFRAGTLVNTGLQMLAGMLSAGVGLLLLLLFSPLAFAATLGFLGLSALLVLVCIRKMLRHNEKSVVLSREAGTGFIEALNSLRSIRSMGCEPFVLETYRCQMQRYTRLLFEVDGLRAGIKAGPGLVALLAGVVMFGPWFSGAISLAPQALFAGTSIIIRTFISLGSLMNSFLAFLVDARAAKDLSELVQADTAVSRAKVLPLSAGVVAPEGPALGFKVLELRDLQYAYVPGQPVLQDLSFTFRAGRVYAIIGPSGAGKSSLADLMLGMSEPDAGQILVDDTPMTPETLRRRVILVEQQPRVFSVSVRDNLCLGVTVSDADIKDVLEAVDLVNVIRALPAGIDTLMDYQGSNFSGGQRQRLSIARALLRQPQVLILDEATSALDSQTRDLVVTRIRSRQQQGVVVFITHDETIAELADEVLALRPCQPWSTAI